MSVYPQAARESLSDLSAPAFVTRHIGPSDADRARMLEFVGYARVEDLIAAAVPEAIRTQKPLDLPSAIGEAETLAELRELAGRNQVLTSMIGLGYHDTVTPGVILRNVLENPGWYTAYTPYQPEISQGRLEALLNFQTVVSDLTGLGVAGASLLDEGTAAAEAMTLARRASKSKSEVFVVDADALPQTKAVLATRAAPLGIRLVEADLSGSHAEMSGPLPECFGVLVQYPGAGGRLAGFQAVAEQAHGIGALVVAAADLLALTLVRAPAEQGADIAIGSTQRFGVPMGYGGPHAAYMAVREGLQRQMPGRLVGVSLDADGERAYRLALQTREQHIRREKATSNICTAQVLLAVMASMYAVYHGPDGLRRIARRVHRHATVLAAGLRGGGVEVVHDTFFDTVLARVPGRASQVAEAARERGVNVRVEGADLIGVTCDEKTTAAHLAAVWQAFGVDPSVVELDEATPDALPADLARTSDFMTHPVFHSHHSETAMLRYLRKLQDKDIALDRSMIPLGSCTMKLNATTEMEPITWPEFAGVHPFAPIAQAAGYVELIETLEAWLAEITGYDAVSIQPNAGSQGEFAGLLAISAYHRARGDEGREVCLIPSSAHGTNAASAVMAGMRVVVVACDDRGNVDMADLDAKIAKHRDTLAAIMVTYPSTHGVFEETIVDLCDRVHAAGGQVYVDGANLNALVGLAKLGELGADVSHLNLHKTFCVPHGGGGPGVGPVAVKSHLAPYLPGKGVGAVSAAPYGSAGILPISWAYVRMMGADGLKAATEQAILSANYLARRLAPHYPVLYTGRDGLVAHECIIDLRQITKETGVTVDDVAKRLIDYGFHAPTMSFPVSGTLMIEPTESEDLAELDRFAEAMAAIREEIGKVASGAWDRADNPLRNAPHTAEAVTADTWEHSYSRTEAAYPLSSLRDQKYWSPVRRIDQAYGDRNLVCSCPPLEAYED